MSYLDLGPGKTKFLEKRARVGHVSPVMQHGLLRRRNFQEIEAAGGRTTLTIRSGSEWASRVRSRSRAGSRSGWRAFSRHQAAGSTTGHLSLDENQNLCMGYSPIRKDRTKKVGTRIIYWALQDLGGRKLYTLAVEEAEVGEDWPFHGGMGFGGTHFFGRSQIMSKSGKTLTSMCSIIHRHTSCTEWSSKALRHCQQAWRNFGYRLNMPDQGKPKLVKIVGWSQFRQFSGVIRRQADFKAAQGMRFGLMPSQPKPDQV